MNISGEIVLIKLLYSFQTTPQLFFLTTYKKINNFFIFFFKFYIFNNIDLNLTTIVVELLSCGVKKCTLVLINA